MTGAVAPAGFGVRRLGPGDDALYAGMLDVFAAAFEDPEAYGANRPEPEYVARRLADTSFIALVAVAGEVVIGALAAYVLQKFEQPRAEVYIYDLGVAEAYRRRGVATALIAVCREVAKSVGAEALYVQADHGDDPAVALYTKLGSREDVMHFDIAVG